MISAQILGVEQLTQKLLKAGPIFTANMKRGMIKAASGLRNYIAYNKISGQVLQNRTGHLRAFLFWSVKQEGPDVVGQVYETMPYGKVHEFGMTIHALRAKALRWIGPDGKPRFAKQVVIPARPWMLPGYEENKPQVVETLSAAAEKAALSLAKTSTNPEGT